MKKKRTKSQNARRSRTKGHQFERDVAVLLRSVFPEARRHLEYQDGQAFGVDLAETGSFKFQCKKLQAYAPITKINEIQCDRAFGDIPVLITAGDGLEAMAALPLVELIRLIEEGNVR